MLVGSPLMDWINKAILDFIFEPKIVHVILMNEKGDELVSWAFFNAYPVAVKIADLNAAENKYAVETLELAYDYFKRTDKK